MVKISLLHPSRGRAKRSYENTKDWLSKSGDVCVEVILSTDLSDNSGLGYFNTYPSFPNDAKSHYVRHYCNDNDCVVQATNAAAKQCTGDILVYLSDDFKCPDNWGELIIKEFENDNRPLVLRVDDCLQRFDTPIITIPIMNRELYNKLGYFWHPEYKSMFCDEDLFWTAMSIGAVKNCPNLKFPHEHYSNGKAKRDETYIRSEANWNQGKEVFRRRKLEKFKI